MTERFSFYCSDSYQDQDSIKNNFALFDFKAILRQIPTTGFAPAEAFKIHSLPSESGGESMEYLVAVQKFLLKVEGDKREFLFIVATSIADVEREAAELFEMFSCRLPVLTMTVMLNIDIHTKAGLQPKIR